MTRSGRRKQEGRRILPYREEAALEAARSVVADIGHEALAAETSAFFSQRSDADILRRARVLGLDRADFLQNNTEFSEISESTVRRWITTGHIGANKYINSIYLYISDNYSDIFSDCLSMVKLKESELLVRSVREVFRHKRDFSVSNVQKYFGEYALYRPFYDDPKQTVMGLRLSIGPDYTDERGEALGPFDCVMHRGYASPRSDEVREDVLAGKIVPHGATATLFLSGPDQSHFIYYIDYQHGPHARDYDALGGIIIADSAGGDPASAWPFYAERLMPNRTFQPGLFKPDEIPPRALERLGRGAIYWEIRHFPGFGN
jgi:hypothetical protein